MAKMHTGCRESQAKLPGSPMARYRLFRSRKGRSLLEPSHQLIIDLLHAAKGNMVRPAVRVGFGRRVNPRRIQPVCQAKGHRKERIRPVLRPAGRLERRAGKDPAVPKGDLGLLHRDGCIRYACQKARTAGQRLQPPAKKAASAPLIPALVSMLPLLDPKRVCRSPLPRPPRITAPPGANGRMIDGRYV